MPLPREAVYNELNGLEISEILKSRVAALFSTVPYFQRHLTLQRVRMVLNVELIVRADQPGGERHRIADDFQVRTDGATTYDEPFDIRLAGHDTVNSAPGQPDSRPPGQIRYEHGLPDAVPTRGPIATEDAQLLASDVPMPPDANFGRLPTEQEKLAAHRAQQDARRIAEAPPEPVTLPGVMVERGNRQTHVTMDRGGPAIGGNNPAPVESPNLRNAGAAPDAEARAEFDEFRGSGISKGNRRT
jgi:hypothetical protein